MTILTNTFAGGTSGTNITAGNSGGTSGDALDAVEPGFGGTCTYSSAQSIHSGLSGNMDLTSSGYAFVEWTTSLTASSITQVWFRMYCYIPSLPGFGNYLLTDIPTSGFGATLVVESSGNLRFLDSNGSAQIISTLTAPTGAWFRLEGFIIASATVGQLNLQMFTTNPEGVTPDEDDTTAATLNTGNAITGLTFGVSNQTGAGGAFQVYLDGLGASTTGYLGPVASPPATVTAYSMRLT